MKGSNKILKRLKSCELMKLKQTLGNYLKTLCWRRMDNSLKFFQDRKKRKIRQNLLPLLKGKDSKITLRLLKTSSHHEVSLLEYKRYFKPWFKALQKLCVDNKLDLLMIFKPMVDLSSFPNSFAQTPKHWVSLCSSPKSCSLILLGTTGHILFIFW